MKKYLLTALLWVFALCSSFASAGWSSDSTVSNCPVSFFAWWDDYHCDDKDYCYGIAWNDEWLLDNIYLWITYSPTSSPVAWYSSYWMDACDEWVCISDYKLSEEEDQFFNSTSPFTITSCVYSDSQLTYTPGGDIWESGGVWLPILSWWTTSLSWIIAWLDSTITEFIPYLVYLGLWIITVIIWFVAIRWLVNRTQAKIRWTFSSWRRRR